VTADLAVFAAHGLYGTSCITALTVQSTMGVRASHAVGADVVSATLDCLLEDLSPAGVKIGMLASAANVLSVGKYLGQMRMAGPGHVPVVLDPVLRSSSGRELLDADGLTAVREVLLPWVGWVTPNIEELAALSGLPVGSHEELAGAARALQASVGGGRRGQALGILAKGGHLEPPDDLLLMPDGVEHRLRGERIETTSTHGTGCALSSAFVSRLVLGDSAVEAARGAKEYVAGALRGAVRVGHGTGPLNLRHSGQA
jgi:hydroxymethylpyrimidine/phosphomethylpyrimidine kinase